MKLGIITAMSSEHKQVAMLLSEKKEVTEGRYAYTLGRIGRHEVVLTQCGIGKVNAAAGAVELILRHQPDCVISTGVAGGIDTCLKVMDVVVSSQVVYHDVWCGEGNVYGQVQGLPARFEGNSALLDCAMHLETETPIHGGLICSGDKFITDRSELDAIKKDFPEGLAVDMESGALAQVCHLYGVPFISFRIISDTPGAENHWQQYTNFWGTIADKSFEVTKTFLMAVPERVEN
jgi:adenosylhomocysteine nucleosidase